MEKEGWGGKERRQMLVTEKGEIEEGRGGEGERASLWKGSVGPKPN